MPLQSMYNHQNVQNHGHLNYSNYQQIPPPPQPQQPQQPQQQKPFGPTHLLCDINLIRLQLGNDAISEQYVLSMARDALLHGIMERMQYPEYNNLICYNITYKHMKFVLTEGFDAVVTINWIPQQNHLIGDIYSTFHHNTNYNTNQLQQIQQTQQPPQQQQTQQPPVYDVNPTPLRPVVIQQQQQYNNNKIASSLSYQAPSTNNNYEGLDECIIDEIVNFLDNDVEHDPELANIDFCDDALPDVTEICGEGGIDNNGNAVNRLKNQSSFYSINSVDNHSEMRHKSQLFQNHENSQNNVLYPNPNTATMSSTSSGDGLDINGSLNGHGIEIKVTDCLYNEICARYPTSFQSKQELIYSVQQAIHLNGAPVSQIGDRKEWCVWIIQSLWVFITENDMSNLVDIFTYNQFKENYNGCIEYLKQRKAANKAVKRSTSFRGSKLIKNSSKRSVISNTSSCSTSRRSIFDEHNKNKNKKVSNNKEYHTIYLKPIIERMKQIEGISHIDSDYIIEIVDNSIKNGHKRQISKRTFEFKWKSYTIIMSKSLKTILDVTLSSDKNIITVHPDVVSIISKKCPILDYFTIQKLANRAKLSASFTTKKNDYRQQFIYEYCGCRIVFASNHTTIVEMQCSDPSTKNIKYIKDQTSTKY